MPKPKKLSYGQRIVEALIKLIEPKDISSKLEHLTNPEHIEQMSILEPQQIQAIVAMETIGEIYPETMSILKEVGIKICKYSGSKNGITKQYVKDILMTVAPEQPRNITQINTGATPTVTADEGGKK